MHTFSKVSLCGTVSNYQLALCICVGQDPGVMKWHGEPIFICNCMALQANPDEFVRHCESFPGVIMGYCESFSDVVVDYCNPISDLL